MHSIRHARHAYMLCYAMHAYVLHDYMHACMVCIHVRMPCHAYHACMYTEYVPCMPSTIALARNLFSSLIPTLSPAHLNLCLSLTRILSSALRHPPSPSLYPCFSPGPSPQISTSVRTWKRASPTKRSVFSTFPISLTNRELLISIICDGRGGVRSRRGRAKWVALGGEIE